MWTISLPLRIAISKNKEFSLNLNQYRNAHFHVLDRAKKNFDKLVKHLIKGIPKLSGCVLEYTLYPGTRQVCDVNNVCTIIDKFFADSLVAHGVLEDDNYNFIADSRFKFGYIDKANPRVDVLIRSPDFPQVPLEPVYEGKKEMKIQTQTVVTLAGSDVHTAIREYLSKHMTISPETELGVTESPDGSYQVVFSQESAPEKSKDKPAKAPKMEPKAAMAALKEAAPEAAPVAPASFSPVVTEPVQAPVAVEATPEPKAEETTPPSSAPKGPSLFAGFKRPSNP